MLYSNRQHGFADPFSEDVEECFNLVTKRCVLEYIGELVNNPTNEEHLFNESLKHVLSPG